MSILALDAAGDPSLLDLSPGLAEWAGQRAVATGRPHFVLRGQRGYFLLGPGDRHLPDPGRALAWAKGVGIPVYRRIAGGSLVFLDAGCLSFAHATPGRDMTQAAKNFVALTRPVRDALAGLGVAAVFGSARGSYCEGPWDLLAEGKKIAGTAQAIRSGFALVSGMLLVTQDPARATGLVNDFYEQAGAGRPFDGSAVTSLARLSGGRITVDVLKEAILAALGPCETATFAAADAARVRTTLGERRVV